MVLPLAFMVNWFIEIVDQGQPVEQFQVWFTVDGLSLEKKNLKVLIGSLQGLGFSSVYSNR